MSRNLINLEARTTFVEDVVRLSFQFVKYDELWRARSPPRLIIRGLLHTLCAKISTSRVSICV